MTKEIKNKIKNVIDTMGIIGSDIGDYIIEVEKENEELKKAVAEFSSLVEKMKCCDNCKHCHRQYEDTNCDFRNEYDDVICSRGYFGNIDGWELAE